MSFGAIILLGLLEGNTSLRIGRISEWTKWDEPRIRSHAKELSDRNFASLNEDMLTVLPGGLEAIKGLKGA